MLYSYKCDGYLNFAFFFCKLISQNLTLYMISVRQTRSLPVTSFKFRLTIYPLVVQPYTFFSLGVLKIFPIRVCPCLTNKKACHSSLQQTYLLSFLFILYLPSFLFLLQNILPVLPLLLLLFSILFLSSYISFLSIFSSFIHFFPYFLNHFF